MTKKLYQNIIVILVAVIFCGDIFAQNKSVPNRKSYIWNRKVERAEILDSAFFEQLESLIGSILATDNRMKKARYITITFESYDECKDRINDELVSLKPVDFTKPVMVVVDDMELRSNTVMVETSKRIYMVDEIACDKIVKKTGKYRALTLKYNNILERQLFKRTILLTYDLYTRKLLPLPRHLIYFYQEERHLILLDSQKAYKAE